MNGYDALVRGNRQLTADENVETIQIITPLKPWNLMNQTPPALRTAIGDRDWFMWICGAFFGTFVFGKWRYGGK